VGVGDPYRSRPKAPPFPARGCAALDVDVFAALVFVWLVSGLRLGVGAVRSEALGQELGLALVVIVTLPWIARENLARAWRRG
jgi:hypothetical protein